MSAPAPNPVAAAGNAAATTAKVAATTVGTAATTAATNVKNAAASTAKVLAKAANTVGTAAANVGKNISVTASAATATLEEAPFSVKTLLLIIVGLAAFFGLIWGFMNSRVYATVKSDLGSVPTPANNQKFTDIMIQKQIPIADALMAEHRPILGSEGGGGKGTGGTAGEVGLALPDMAAAERLFVNFHVLGTRLGGFLGNSASGGLYSADRAVELALRKGCRLFLLEIDYLERAPEVPVLVYRDLAGNNMSRNTGSIGGVMRALKKHTKDQKLIADDPLIVVLYMRRIPGDNSSSKEALNFMGAVAGELQAITPYLYKPPASGAITEGDVLKQPLEAYANSVVVLTNADTSGFTSDNAATITEARKLNKYVHARVYAGSTKGPIDGLEDAKAGSIAGAKAYSYDYFLTLPTTGQTADTARNTWSLAMSPSLDVPPSATELDLLMDKLGVQGIAVDIFSEGANSENVYAANRFKTFSYVPKPKPTRIAPPVTGNVEPTNTKLNPNGGVVVTTPPI